MKTLSLIKYLYISLAVDFIAIAILCKIYLEYFTANTFGNVILLLNWIAIAISVFQALLYFLQFSPLINEINKKSIISYYLVPLLHLGFLTLVLLPVLNNHILLDVLIIYLRSGIIIGIFHVSSRLFIANLIVDTEPVNSNLVKRQYTKRENIIS